MRWQCQLARSLDSAKGVPLHAVQHSRHRAAGRGGVIVIENSANFNFSAAPMSVVVKSVSKIGAPGSSRKRDKSGGARTDEQFVQRYSRGDKSVKRVRNEMKLTVVAISLITMPRVAWWCAVVFRASASNWRPDKVSSAVLLSLCHLPGRG